MRQVVTHGVTPSVSYRGAYVSYCITRLHPGYTLGVTAKNLDVPMVFRIFFRSVTPYTKQRMSNLRARVRARKIYISFEVFRCNRIFIYMYNIILLYIYYIILFIFVYQKFDFLGYTLGVTKSVSIYYHL